MTEQLWTRELGRQRKAEQRRKADEQFTAALILASDEYRRWCKAAIIIPGINAPVASISQADYDQTMAAATGRGGY